MGGFHVITLIIGCYHAHPLAFQRFHEWERRIACTYSLSPLWPDTSSEHPLWTDLINIVIINYVNVFEKILCRSGYFHRRGHVCVCVCVCVCEFILLDTLESLGQTVLCRTWLSFSVLLLHWLVIKYMNVHSTFSMPLSFHCVVLFTSEVKEGSRGAGCVGRSSSHMKPFCGVCSVDGALEQCFPSFTARGTSWGSCYNADCDSPGLVWDSWVYVSLRCPGDADDSGLRTPLWVVLFFFFILGLHPQYMEVPRPGVESQLQLPAYTTATAMPYLSHVCTAHGNAGSLTHWVRPGIESETSWFTVGYVSTVPWQELLSKPLDKNVLSPIFLVVYCAVWEHLCKYVPKQKLLAKKWIRLFLQYVFLFPWDAPAFICFDLCPWN